MIKKMCRWALDPFIVYTLFFFLLLLLNGANGLESIKEFLLFILSSGIAFIFILAWVKTWVFIKKFE